MPRWKIHAADADTGQPFEWDIDQPTREEAIRFANSRGARVLSINLDQPAAPVEMPGRSAAPSSDGWRGTTSHDPGRFNGHSSDGLRRGDHDTSARGSPARDFQKSRSPEPPGAVHCPQCDGWRWKSRWPFSVIFLAIIIFPVGLIGFLISHRRHACRTCGYTYSSKTDPPAWTGDPTRDEDSRPSEEAHARADRAARTIRRLLWPAFFLTAAAIAWYFLTRPLT